MRGELYAASIRHRAANGPRAGRRVARLGDHVAADGRLRYRLKHRWRDGTTHIVFEPGSFSSGWLR